MEARHQLWAQRHLHERLAPWATGVHRGAAACGARR